MEYREIADEFSNGQNNMSPDETGLNHTLTQEQATTAVEIFATLGNNTRYEALRIVAATDESVCVCELASVLDISQSAVSQALSTLCSAGLVERHKDGKWRYFTSTPHARRVLNTIDAIREGKEAEDHL